MTGREDKRPPRKVMVGGYRIIPPASGARDSATTSLVGRAKRHLRGVAVGHRKVEDPDEEVRILPKPPATRRPLSAGSFLDDDDE